MKIGVVFLLFVLFTSISSKLSSQESSLLIAFNAIKNFLLKSNREVTIMNFADDQGVFDKFLLKMLKSDQVPVKIKTKFMKFLRRNYQVREQNSNYSDHLSQ